MTKINKKYEVLTRMFKSSRIVAYVSQKTPLSVLVRERKNGMYSTLFVCITCFCHKHIDIYHKI